MYRAVVVVVEEFAFLLLLVASSVEPVGGSYLLQTHARLSRIFPYNPDTALDLLPQNPRLRLEVKHSGLHEDWRVYT